jgi:hypothetical protein
MIGRIYKITNTDESIIYIGSTTMKLKDRWQLHLSHYQRWIAGIEKNTCTIYHVFKDQGVEGFQIHLISTHNVNDREQLRKQEQLIIDNTDCVNQARAYVSPAQQRERVQQYAEANRDRKIEYNHNYYADNKEALIDATRAYREQNREKIIQASRERYNTNREQLLAQKRERIECVCGATITRGNKSKHERTAKHQQWE